MADTWFTSCTYTRVAPPELSSLSGTDPIVQFLQNMPYGEVARSLEARMQRLLLVATAENALLLMQWSERPGCKLPASGSLVCLDQVQLRAPVLQFLRQEPNSGPFAAPPDCSSSDCSARLMRTFPWEGECLLRRLPVAETAKNCNANSTCTDSDSATTRAGSDVCDSAETRRKPQKGLPIKDRSYQVHSLVRDFPSYGLAIVDKTSGRVFRSLDHRALAQEKKQNAAESQGQLLAFTPLPSRPGVFASIVSKQNASHCASCAF